jgi:hypothetical protein
MNQVKIKVRPQKTVRFPGLCVHCDQPAVETMRIRKRIGRITRLIDVPICTACAVQLRRKSADEERLQKTRLLVSGVLFLLALTLTLLLTPPALTFGLRFLIALSAAAAIALIVTILFQRAIYQAVLPEKQAIRRSAQIIDFSWRATTFAFQGEAFTERFKSMNTPLLMEINT